MDRWTQGEGGLPWNDQRLSSLYPISHFVFISSVCLLFEKYRNVVFSTIHKSKFLVEVDLSSVKWKEGNFKKDKKGEWTRCFNQGIFSVVGKKTNDHGGSWKSLL